MNKIEAQSDAPQSARICRMLTGSHRYNMLFQQVDIRQHNRPQGTKKLENGKKEELQKKRIPVCSEVLATVREICGVSLEKEKRGYGGKDLQKRKILRLFVEHVVHDVAGHGQLLIVVVVILRLATTAAAALMLRVERANGAAQLTVASVVEHDQ